MSKYDLRHYNERLKEEIKRLKSSKINPINIDLIQRDLVVEGIKPPRIVRYANDGKINHSTNGQLEILKMCLLQLKQTIILFKLSTNFEKVYVIFSNGSRVKIGRN